jgi:hypothetical protein
VSFGVGFTLDPGRSACGSSGDSRVLVSDPTPNSILVIVINALDEKERLARAQRWGDLKPFQTPFWELSSRGFGESAKIIYFPDIYL